MTQILEKQMALAFFKNSHWKRRWLHLMNEITKATTYLSTTYSFWSKMNYQCRDANKLLLLTPKNSPVPDMAPFLRPSACGALREN